MKQLERLRPEIEERACENILAGYKLDAVARDMGLNRRKLQIYLIQHPEFAVMVDNALLAQCMYLEEDLLNCADDYGKDVARTKLEAIAKILKYRNPKRYGDKTQIDMTVSVDISGAIDAAERRVEQIVATNVIAIGIRDEKD